MSDGEKLAGAQETGPTGDGSMNREHWGDAEMMASSTVPFSWQGKVPHDARHGQSWGELDGARETSPRDHDSPN
jgi:hypothetical protein